MQTVGQQAVSRVEAVVAAAALPLRSKPHRSTTEQREAFLEQLYSDYAELQGQRDEIDSRKRQMDFEVYESNHHDIHDLLFANLDAAHGALGDWDTWEKVEAAVKRYAYGKPRHTAREKNEMCAMQSHIEKLREVLQAKSATVQCLTGNLDSVQKELAGVLRLLHLQENEIRKLKSQNSTTKLQLRSVERECAVLRGFRTENELSALKEDLRFLIEANKTLEQENAQLRRHLNARDSGGAAAGTHDASLDVQAATPSLLHDEAHEPPTSGVMDDDLNRCMEEDDYRRNLMHQIIPISGAIVDGKCEVEQWKRRLEAEVSSALAMLDRDALLCESIVRAPLDCSATWESPPMKNVFTSYATYQSSTENNPWLKSICVVSAPPLVTTTSALVTSHLCTSTDAQADAREVELGRATPPLLQAATQEPVQREGHQQNQGRDRKPRSLSHAPRRKKTATATVAPVAAHNAAEPLKKIGTVSAPGGRRASLTTAAAAPSTSAALVKLKSAVLQCAELSRANALRRELLHAAWFRQHLHEERERVASLGAVQPHSCGQRAALTIHEDTAHPEEAKRATRTSASDVLPKALANANKAEGEVLHLRALGSPISAPERLRHLVEESRPSTGETQEGGGALERGCIDDADDSNSGDEVSQSARRASSSLSLALDAQTAPTERKSPVPLIALGDESSAMNDVATERGMLQSFKAAVHEPLLLLAHGSGQASGGAVFAAECAAPDKTEARLSGRYVRSLAVQAEWLRQQVQQLGLDAASFGNEVQEALHLLSTLLVQQQLHVQHVTEEEMERAVRATAQETLEEAAVVRATHLLEEQFNAQFSQDFYGAATASLPDTATDEEWVAHNLRLAALAMVRETLQPYVRCTDDGGEYDAGASSQAFGSARAREPWLLESQEDSAGCAHQFFADDLVQLPKPLPKSTLGTVVHSSAADASDSNDHRVVVEVPREAEDVDTLRVCGKSLRNGQRTLGHVQRPVRVHWYWRARDPITVPSPRMAHHGASLEPQMPGRGRSAALFSMPMPSLWRASPADVDSIRPTVLRYDLGPAARQAQERVNTQVKQATAYICGSRFDDFVREYVVPIISTATRLTNGADVDEALRAAVRQLRAEASERCKRCVCLLFRRVASTIRTRRLLRGRVFHGEAFVSYVGVLYNMWRHRLEQERRQMHVEQREMYASVVSLMKLHAPAAGAVAKTPAAAGKSRARRPGSGVTGDGHRLPPYEVQLSSYHFDKVRFDDK
ncbi:hypothetical protein, conserved [Leishmania lindenbergi]|uniref:Uncharacterized protein n=1 Tax=Leishmania lindenbergi TaxID=651832 RepID=A0AAW3AB61_9TRYP